MDLRDINQDLVGIHADENKIATSPSVGVISTVMASHIAMSRKEVSLFGNDLVTAITKAQKDDEGLIQFKALGEKGATIDRNGKPFALTNFRVRLIAHLSRYITMQLKAKDISEYMEAIKQGKTPPSRIVRPVMVRPLAKEIYHGRARTENVAHLLRELYELCNTKQVQYYQIGADNKKKPYTAYILQIESVGGTSRSDFHRMTDEQLAEVDFVELAFGRIFFLDLSNRYAHLPKKLLDLWGEKGNGTETELFAIVLMSLLSKYWQVYSTAKNSKSKAKAEAKAEELKGEERKEAISKAQYKALKRTLPVADINDMLAKPYKPNNRSRLFGDIERAFTIFKEIDLIEEYTIDKKQSLIEYTFSLGYGKEREEDTLLGLE